MIAIDVFTIITWDASTMSSVMNNKQNVMLL